MDNTARIKKIDQENLIFVICIILIIFSLWANSFEKKYFLYNNSSDKDMYLKLQAFIFLIAIVIYLFFFADSYSDYKKITPFDSNKKKFLTEANLFATTLFLIAGIVFFMIVINDKDLDTEITFT